MRRSLNAGPIYEFEVSFDGLASSAAAGSLTGLGANSLQTLMGFHLQCQGQLGPFLYTDPTESVARGQGIGTSDGATTAFPMVRSLGGFTGGC